MGNTVEMAGGWHKYSTQNTLNIGSWLRPVHVLTCHRLVYNLAYSNIQQYFVPLQRVSFRVLLTMINSYYNIYVTPLPVFPV